MRSSRDQKIDKIQLAIAGVEQKSTSDVSETPRTHNEAHNTQGYYGIWHDYGKGDEVKLITDSGLGMDTYGHHLLV